MFAASCHLASGGYLIAEHPARPRQADRPSIWTAAIVELLRRHPDAYLHHFDQYLFGAVSVKPTGLLAVNLPAFRREMTAAADWTAPRPTTMAIGLGDDGNFKTAGLKEYPGRFSAALARVMCRQLDDDLRAHSWRLAPISEEEWA